MDRLPPDILEEAASWACVDGGATGCALSAVSRTMRQACARLRYRSVALRGPRQIRAFIELIRWSQEPSKPRKFWRSACDLPKPDVRVHRLFLADCDMRPDDPRAATAWSQWQPHGGLRGRIGNAFAWTGVQTHADSESHWSESVVDVLSCVSSGATSPSAWARNSALAQAAVHALLALLAPTLTHLHMNTWMPFSWAPLPEIVFPTLRELTSSMRTVDSRSPKMDLARIAPVLRRMHIVGDFEYCPQSLSTITSFPLSLSHLRISECTEPPWVIGVLNETPGRQRWESDCLQKIIIAPHAYNTASAAAMGEFKHYVIFEAQYPTCRFDYWPGDVPGRDAEPVVIWDYGAWRREASEHYNLIPKTSIIREVSSWTEERLYNDWLEAVQGQSMVWEEGVPLAVGEE